MTKELDELRQVAERATPGPWEREGTGVLGEREAWDLGNGPARIMKAQMPWQRERMEANAEHVATFDPPTVLALIDRAEAAEQAVERAHAVDALQRRDKGALYRRAEVAEAAIQRVREVMSDWETDEDAKGLHFDLERALDGGEQE